MSSINLFDTIITQAKLSKKKTTKQQRILETAITMFAEKGYANTSTSEIAKVAGVAEATIFRHYGTKENLLLSVIIPFLKESAPILTEELYNEIRPQNFDTFGNFLRALLNNRMSFVKENREIFQIVVKEFIYREELRKGLLPHIDNNLLKNLNKSLDMFKRRGEIVDLPNKTLIRMILSVIGGYFAFRFILLPENVVMDDALEFDNLIHFISNGLRNPTKYL